MIIRVALLLALVVLYFWSGMFSEVGIWPVILLIFLLESIRTNRRIDAMIEIDKLTNENDQTT